MKTLAKRLLVAAAVGLGEAEGGQGASGQEIGKPP